MRLKLILTYDGRLLEGYQAQPGGNTVQDFLEAAVAETAKEKIRVHSAGRTDAGVHALAQVVHFDAPDHLTMNPFNWVPALNTKLPASVRVLACEEAAPDFHARFSAIAKTYRYDLCTDPVLSPFKAGLVWHLPRQLDPDQLAQALAIYQGRHDFEALSARRGNETESTDYHRTIHSALVHPISDGWRLTFTGDGFLYKMVRMLTGAAVQAAQGRLRLDEVAAFLDPKSTARPRSAHCAPSDGLFLESVNYGSM